MASTTVFKVPLRRNFSDSHLAGKIIEDYTPPEESGTTGSSKWDAKGIEKSRSASNSPVSCTKSELIEKRLEPRALTYQIPEKLNRSQLSSSQELLAHYASYLKNPVTTEQLQNLSKTAKQWTKYTLSMYKYYVNGKEDLPSDIKQDELMFSKSCPECQYNNYALSKVLTSVMQGYRTCGLCSQVFCYQHTSFKRRVSINNSLNKSNVSTHQLFELDPDGSWIHVCKRCFEKDKDQTLGQTKDHSSTFVERRAKKNNLREKRQDKILKKLEKLSQEEPDDVTSTSFSLWSVATVLPLKIPVSVPFSSASSSKSCNICSIEFSFWTKSQSCQLCSFECCSSCCQYTVPLSKSLVNPNAPENRQGDLSICKYCHDLISSKKKRIKFSLLCNSEETKKFVQMYQFASDLKREIDKRLEEYLSKTSTLESEILDSFLLVSEDDDSPTEVNFSESVRTESQQLFDNLLPMFIEYEKIVQQLLSVPCSTEKQRRIMHNLKVAFMQSQAYTVIAQQRMAETLQRKQASQQ